MKKDERDIVLIEGLRDKFTFFIENATEKEYYELLEQQLIKQQIEIDLLKEINTVFVEEFAILGSSVGYRLWRKCGKKED